MVKFTSSFELKANDNMIFFSHNGEELCCYEIFEGEKVICDNLAEFSIKAILETHFNVSLHMYDEVSEWMNLYTFLKSYGKYVFSELFILTDELQEDNVEKYSRGVLSILKCDGRHNIDHCNVYYTTRCYSRFYYASEHIIGDTLVRKINDTFEGYQELIEYIKEGGE